MTSYLHPHYPFQDAKEPPVTDPPVGKDAALRTPKTHCINGHAYDEENTRWYRGKRNCRACAKITNRKSKEKHRGDIIRKNLPIEAYFERGAPDECWPWMGGRVHFGYGRYRGLYAMRVMYEREYGPIPPGLMIRHKCDNPPCVNQAHMELGTNADNMADATRRGRWPQAKLTWDAVCEIRRLRGIVTIAELAKRFGVSDNAIWQVQAGKSYKYAPEPAALAKLEQQEDV